MIQLNYLFVTLWVVVYGKIEIVFDGDMENCGEGRNFDFSNLDFIPYNDTHIFLNGSFTFITEVRPPWYLRAAFEKFQNGKWQQSKLNRKIPDFCSVIHNPTEPWYSITKNFMELKCPVAAGKKLVFINQQLNDFNLEYPPNFVGKWRFILQNDIVGGGPTKFKQISNNCHKFTFDVVET